MDIDSAGPEPSLYLVRVSLGRLKQTPTEEAGGRLHSNGIDYESVSKCVLLMDISIFKERFFKYKF